MKRAFTLLELLFIVSLVVIAAAILFPIFARTRYPNHGAGCASNFKQLGLAILQYAQDYDDRFPLAHSTATTGWGNDIYPYIKSYNTFQCPSGTSSTASNTSSPTSAGVTFTSDYFYNRLLEKVPQRKISYSSLTILAGDGPDNAPSWSNQIALSADAITNSASPAWRHDDRFGKGAYYLFADGHVKSFLPDQISNSWSRPDTGAPRFPIR